MEDDHELMRQVQAGDTAAFQRLANRYRQPLKHFFAALLPDPLLADDYVQETLLRLWTSRHRYEPTGKFSTYLFQIGKNYYLNQKLRYKWRAQHEAAATCDDIELIAPPASQPEIVLLERLEIRRRERAVAALPAYYRAVFVLSHYEGLRYAEIAERLAIPVGTVKSRMAEAVRRLRVALAPDDAE